eukprot:CAMPEP_0206020962 /NCGR_PEP_ID=MMETSP1464-20131121/32006_1 /ASSEMBLY_ACC=CAM_ASM_001124 /TAXON_ID=119497 /ORGANISM="Exanthemachrysis gayraliae, Strain RCC1523" /LENGTH=63 /DNA_ID=CAMNT_0053394905 /DNA_START=586 /DNA_END=773 /DNA_ORIENTATION=-
MTTSLSSGFCAVDATCDDASLAVHADTGCCPPPAHGGVGSWARRPAAHSGEPTNAGRFHGGDS